MLARCLGGRALCCRPPLMLPPSPRAAGDTKGIVGPASTWREVQWKKIRYLVDKFGLKPWYMNC